MLQVEDILTTGPVASRDLPERDTGRGLVHDEGEVSRPLSRDIPREAREQSAPPAQAGGTGRGDTPRKRASRPLVLSLGALLLASVAGAGYLYWDNAGHSRATDDAFVEARQFSVAPKVRATSPRFRSPTISTSRPDSVIARIDDRDYRIALEQAEAQVAPRRPASRTSTRRSPCRRPRSRRAQAQVPQQQAGLTFAQQQAARYKNLAARTAGAPSSMPSRHVAAAPGRGCAATRRARPSRRRGSWSCSRRSAAAPRRTSPQAEAQRDQAKLNLVLHDGHRRAAGPRRAASGGGRRSTRSRAPALDDVRAGRHLGHGQLQGDAARPTCARPAGDDRDRCLPGPHDPAARWPACSPAPAPPSRCCRRRTPPATT